MLLSRTLGEQFNRDGFLIMENVFKPEEVEALRRRTTDIANGVVTTYPEADIEYEPGTSRERRLANIRKLNHCDVNDAAYRDAARNPGILDVIESLLGPDIKLEGEQLFMKPPGGIEKTYHQDGPYFCLDPISFVSAWIAIDDVTEENGCLRVIAGSHLLGPVPHSDIWMVGERKDMKIPERFIDRSKEVSIVMTSKEGYRVESANSGADGLRLARELHPSAIILDVMMPGMDGWAVLSQLKSTPGLADIPVVMLTITDEKNLGYALGADEYLTKPIDRQQLIEALVRVVSPVRERVET